MEGRFFGWAVGRLIGIRVGGFFVFVGVEVVDEGADFGTGEAGEFVGLVELGLVEGDVEFTSHFGAGIE